MAKTVNKSSLGYLGQEFQFKLVKCFIEDQKFFINIQHIVDQNMFTDENLRRIVGFMKDRYNFTETVTTYSELRIIIRSKIFDAVSVEMVIATLEKIEQYDLSGMDIIEEEAEKFFKQQNLTRAINKAQEIIKKGDGSNYYQIEELVKKALEVNTKQEFGWRLFENIESDLSEDYRITIPTGATKLDEALYGGLGKGELGIVIAPLGTGKAQPLHSKILTPQGYKTMGEIEVGDYVIGGDGKKTKVLATFPQGIRPVYKVEFTNGTTCECDINHLWSVNTYFQRKRKTYVKGSGAKHPKRVFNPDRTFKTVSLQEIIDKGLKRINSKGEEKEYIFNIPTVKPVEFDSQEIEINPYLLGYYIGDGCYKRTCITVGNNDYNEIYELLNNASDNNIKTSYYKERNIWSFYLQNELKEKCLNKLGTCNSIDKSIPKEYMYNNINVRCEVLRGLMDSYGYVDKKGCVGFTTKSRQLAEDIRFIIRSLGGNANIREKKTFYKNKKTKERVYCGICYVLSISFESDIIPFKLKRKVERYRPRCKYFNQTSFKNITFVRNEETKCILVDSDEHTYITEDFIVTHNTSCTTGFAAAAAISRTTTNNNNGFKVLHFYFEDDDANIRRKYYGYVTDIDACDLSTPEWRPIAIQRLNEDCEIRRMLHDNIMGERLSTGEVTASEIKRKIKSYIARGFKPDLVIIDYFECIKPEKSDDFGASEWSKEGISMRKLESTAKELNVAIWVPVQGTKDSIGAEIVGVNQAGGSVKKTQIGHVVITLAQTPEQKVKGKLNMFIGKLRAARIGRNRFMNIGFNNGTLKFDMSECDDEDDDVDKIDYSNYTRGLNVAKSTRDSERMKKQY